MNPPAPQVRVKATPHPTPHNDYHHYHIILDIDHTHLSANTPQHFGLDQPQDNIFTAGLPANNHFINDTTSNTTLQLSVAQTKPTIWMNINQTIELFLQQQFLGYIPLHLDDTTDATCNTSSTSYDLSSTPKINKEIKIFFLSFSLCLTNDDHILNLINFLPICYDTNDQFTFLYNQQQLKQYYHVNADQNDHHPHHHNNNNNNDGDGDGVAFILQDDSTYALNQQIKQNIYNFCPIPVDDVLLVIKNQCNALQHLFSSKLITLLFANQTLSQLLTATPSGQSQVPESILSSASNHEKDFLGRDDVSSSSSSSTSPSSSDLLQIPPTAPSSSHDDLVILIDNIITGMQQTNPISIPTDSVTTNAITSRHVDPTLLFQKVYNIISTNNSHTTQHNAEQCQQYSPQQHASPPLGTTLDGLFNP